MNTKTGREETLNLQKDWQPEIDVAKSALEKTNKEKYPKLYDSRKKLLDTLQYNDNMRKRAEKAESSLKESKSAGEKTPIKQTGEKTPIKSSGEGTPTTPQYSLQDIRALNDVHDDDIEVIQDWAKFKGISVAEAKKESHIQNLLRTREEERKTAKASNTGKGRGGTSKVSGKSLHSKFMEKGEIPEDDEEMKKLAEARYTSPK